MRNAAISAVLGAMGQLAPETMAGDIKGTSNHTYIAGDDPRDDEPYLFYEYPAGGTGATAQADGNSAVRNFAEGDFGSIQPAEAVEHTCALLVERCEIRADSCGAGRYRGGFGLRRDIRVLSETGLLSIASDKNVVPPFGVMGGRSGSPNEFRVIRDGRELPPSETPGKVAGFRLRRGDVVSLRSSGGGGWGDPLDRDPDEVLADVRDGYLTPEAARRDFGVVVLDAGEVDPEATAAARDALRGRRGRQEFRVRYEDEPDGSAGLRRCRLSAAAMARLSPLAPGDLVEILSPAGACLRAWVEGPAADGTGGGAEAEGDAGSVRLGRSAERVLRAGEGLPVRIRPLARGTERSGSNA